MEFHPLISLAEGYARLWHRDQTYSDIPYADGHLVEVVKVLVVFGHHEDWEMLSAGWMHDGPEDAPTPRSRTARINLIEAEFSTRTANLVHAVTGVGQNRKERNANAYAKIAMTPEAPVLKGADRLINARSSQGSSLHNMYVKEYPGFRELVAGSIPPSMLDMLDEAHGRNLQ